MKAGMKPISNIVDITNYVLLEYGQPIHAFDLETIEGHEIIVRAAKKDEVLTTLDNVERKLSENMIVIADGNKAIALAGVMGGEDTEVSSKTKSLLIEVANFNKKNIPFVHVGQKQSPFYLHHFWTFFYEQFFYFYGIFLLYGHVI